MVVGFERETQNLSEADLLLAKQFMNSFRKRVGREKKITSSEIEMKYKNIGIKMNGHKIRAIVHHIRYHRDIVIGNKRYFLISDNTGYWLSSEMAEIQKFAKSLEERAGSILSIKLAVDHFLTGHASNNFINENQGDLFQHG
jgi:hypothetical protein